MDGKVHVVTCGTESQLSELQHALHECIVDGFWLVVQNAHMSGTWNQELLELIRVSWDTLMLDVIKNNPEDECIHGACHH